MGTVSYPLTDEDLSRLSRLYEEERSQFLDSQAQEWRDEPLHDGWDVELSGRARSSRRLDLGFQDRSLLKN